MMNTSPSTMEPRGINAAILCGHPRSGTTLIYRMLSTHPKVIMTFEFGAFWAVDVPFKLYRKRLRTGWMRVVESMERNAEGSHSVRYNPLIANPEGEQDKIGSYLDGDSGLLNAGMIRKEGAGKFRGSLSAEDHGMVLDITSPVMQRLGY